jgi:phosphate transport system substrate-binding protein
MFDVRLQRLVLFVAVVMASSSFVTPAPAAATTLSGAGSTLIAPLEAEWGQSFSDYTGIGVSYQPVGAQTGVTDVANGVVDFAATDAPLSATRSSGCDRCIQLPWALSAVGISYRIHGLRASLRLTGPVLAKIYLGQITSWDDHRIQALNHGVHLPALRISPLWLSGSGETYALTDYLSRVSPSFRVQVGVGTTVSFPVGTSANADVVSLLQSTDGAIGYVAVPYLIAHHLPAAEIENASGHFEVPNLPNIEAAAKTVRHVPANNELHIVDPPGRAGLAYPICTFSYAVVPAAAPQKTALKRFISYALGTGQAFAPRLDFASLPKVVLTASKATLRRL